MCNPVDAVATGDHGPPGAAARVGPVSDVTQPRDGGRARKARGAFFTPPELCDHLTRWAVRGPGDAVLEPSCGDAEFAVSAARRLRGLGAADPHVVGVELHADSARQAADRLRAGGFTPRIDVGDFFARPPVPEFDAVVGNPPYVRYQGFTGDARTAARQAALAAGVRLSALASSWAAFTVHAALFLRPHGRLALVLPAELLSVNYAAEVRAFLMRRFARVRLVLFTQRVFPGVMEEVVLVQAEGQGPTDHCELHQVRDLDDLVADDQVVSRWSPRAPGDKWTESLVDPAARDAYERATSHAATSCLLDWGETSLGTVTGNNRYFTLTAADVDRLALAAEDVVPISPPGSKHLRPLLDLDPGTWARMAGHGARAWLVSPAGAPSAGAQRYFADGERDAIDQAYKCRTRAPWWRPPLLAPPDLLFTYMNADAPRLVGNSARVHHINSVHGVYLRPGYAEAGGRLLPLAALNSVTLLGAEIVGRAYGGGVLKLEPREADALPVPSPALLGALADALGAIRAQAGELVAARRLVDAVAVVDAVVLRDGMDMSAADITRLREARAHLHARRTARGRAPA